MQRVIVFGCQQIAVEFLDHLGGLSDTTVPLVVTSESEHDELFGGCVRERIEQYAFHQAENGGIRTDPESQRGQSNDRQHRLAHERTKRNFEIS